MASLFVEGKFQGLDASGAPLAGGKLYTYFAGTLTNKATYTTQAGTVANANPVILDSSGRAAVWMGSGAYRMVLKDAGDVTVWDTDNIGSPGEGENVRDYGAVGDGVTDDAEAIQAAIDAVYAGGGGRVTIPLARHIVGTTIVVPQRVILVGESSAFVNQYVNGSAAPRGSTLFAAAGLNADVVQITCRLYSDAGVLKETDLGTRNSDARHFGGLRDLIVWGNRSTTADPTAVDLNSAGHGIKVWGARYVEIERVTTMFCAEDGFRTTDRDYGTGTVFTNNTSVRDLTSLSNGGYGVNAREGDSRYFNINAGYNGLGGVKSQAGNTIFNGGLAWNNRSHGVWVGFQSVASSSSFIGWLSYDNDKCGFKLDGSTGRTAALLSCIARGNGRDTGAAATDRANFYVSATTRDWCILGCESNGYDQDSVQTAQYGYYIDNTTYNGSFSGSSRNAVLADYIFSDAQKMNTNTVPESSVRFGGWDTLSSISANTIPVANKSTITLNCTGAQTVNDISYSGPGLPMVIIRNISADNVTLVHDSSKLRLANATNVVLGQHEAVMMVHVSGSVWQQIGLAA